MGIGRWSQLFSLKVWDVAPARGGVYCLWSHHRSGEWQCAFIGKANNLRRSIRGHLETLEDNGCLTGNDEDHHAYMFLTVSTDWERTRAEKYLYDLMRPACNPVDPGGRPMAVPLPPRPPEVLTLI